METVTWECPGEKAEGKRRRLLSQAASKHAPAEEGAGHGKDAAASPDVQTFASSPPAESNRGLHHSVSFTGEGVRALLAPVLCGVMLCCTVRHLQRVPSVLFCSAARHMWAWAPLAEVRHAQLRE